MSHSDDGIVRVRGFIRMTEMEWVVSWCDGDFITVGKFIIKGSAEIEIFCFISCCCAHIFLPPGAKIDILVERVYFEEYYHNLLFFAQIKLGYIAGKKKNHDVYWYQIIIQQSVIPRGTERVSISENKQIIRLKARRIRNEVHRRLLGEK